MKGKTSPMKGKSFNFSEEKRKQLSEIHKDIPEETRIKMSLSSKKRFEDPLQRQHLREVNKGKPSPLKGRELSKEHCDKISKSKEGNKNWLGKHHSEETKKKLSLTSKGNINVRGRKFINKDGVKKRVYPDELPKFLKEGWKLGIGDTKRSHK